MAVAEALLPQWQEDQVVLNVPAGIWTEAEFFDLCQANPNLRIEQTATGRLIIMPPASTESGGRNADLTADLVLWNRKTRAGKVFDSSAGFTLPNGARYAPDAAWIEKPRWDAVGAADRKRFAHICPDFVAELRSERDSLPVLRDKMREYIANGARLGWLIDPRRRKVEIFRPGCPVEVLDDPQTVSGDPELPGFVLDLTPIWD